MTYDTKPDEVEFIAVRVELIHYYSESLDQLGEMVTAALVRRELRREKDDGETER